MQHSSLNQRVCCAPRVPFSSQSLSTKNVGPFGPIRTTHQRSIAHIATAQDGASCSRRTLTELFFLVPLISRLSACSPALADEETSSATLAPPPKPPQPFFDDDYSIDGPGDYTFVETDPIIQVERGQQPERRAERCRFDSPDGDSVVSVIVRPAQALKPAPFQINDMEQYGTPIETAVLLLPRASRVLSAYTVLEPVPPKKTPYGMADFPPKNYYRYEFTTPAGLHGFMSAVASRGRVYVSGGTSPEEKWNEQKEAIIAATSSLKLRYKR